MERISFSAPRMDLGLDLNSARNLKPGRISSGKSARMERGSGIYTGPGFRLMKDLGTSANAYPFEATVFPLFWAKSGTAIYQTSDPTGTSYYDIGATATSAESGTFVEQGNGDIHYLNQTDSSLRIAVARNTVAIADTDTEITVGADWIGKFSGTNPSTVYIRGDAITYTGKNATQLTGVTGIAAGGHPINSIVTQTSNPSTWTEEKGSFAFEFESRMIVGGRLHFENILYASAPEDLSNPQFFYDFDGNGTVSRVMQGKLQAGIKGIGRAFVFTDRGVYQLNGFDVTTGAFLLDPISEHYGAYNPRCIVDMDGVVAFLGKKRLIPVELALSPDGQVPGLNEDFDQDIRPWLDSLDSDTNQGRAQLFYDNVQKILKISAVRNGSLETYAYDRQNKCFLPQETRSAAGYTMFNGESYFGGINGKIYRDDYGRTNDGIAIDHRWSTGRMEYEEGRRNMQLVTLEYEGNMTQGTEHTLNVYLDGSTTPSYSMLFTDSLITSMQGSPIGARGVGVSNLGGGAPTQFTYPFKNQIVLAGLSCEDIRIEWVVTKEGAFFQVNSYRVVADVTFLNTRTLN